jgi:hypothetical protein
MAGATAAVVEGEARDGVAAAAEDAAAAAAVERTRHMLRKTEISERKIPTAAFHF